MSKNILYAIVCVFIPLMASAETVEIDGINYDLTYIAEKVQTAEVSAKTHYDEFGSQISEYSGVINIPNIVTYQGIDYNVTSIGDYAFRWSSITSINLPNSLTSIGRSAFYGCSKVTSIIIPNNVTSIGRRAFYGCTSLTSISIPNSVTSIGERTFAECSGLFTLTIPQNVKTIGESAFSGCSGLTTVTIPQNVTTIGASAFSGCSGLTTVTIPQNVKTIGASGFANCKGLISVVFQNDVKSLSFGAGAFSGCYNLSAVHILDLAAWCNIRFNERTQNPLWYAHHLFLNNEEIKDLIIPNSVTSIGSYVFSGCENITSISIPNSVTSIGAGSFSSCSGLISVAFQNDVKSLSFGADAFSGCSNLTAVHISDLAAWCNIRFNKQSENPLWYAHHLFLNGEEVKDLMIPNSVTSIGSYVFSGCKNMTSISIPNSVTSIGAGSFYECCGLTTVTIPNSVMSIGSSAFSGCKDLTSLTIPNSMKTINSYAFSNCEKLKDVICLAKLVPSTSSDVFSNSYIEYATLHVYETSIDAYKAASPWKGFKSIIAADIPMFTITYLVDGEVYSSTKYEEGEIITPEKAPTKDGYTFSGWENLPEIMPAEDVTVIGTFIINKYKLTYMVDDEVYKSYELKYGSTIIPEPEPIKDGYVFSGWSEIPEEMPANDVIVTGSLKKISLGKCASPTIALIGGKLVFNCEMEGVEFNYDIKANVSQKGKGNNVPIMLSASISVYTSKDGYDDSDITTKSVQIPASNLIADTNGDGVINAADIVTIVNQIMLKE